MIKYPSISVNKDLMGLVPIPPAVSILLPVHSVLSSKAELRHRLNLALDEARRQLLKNYTEEIALVVMQRLEGLQLKLKENPTQKSIALFASPHTSKLCYLDTVVEERIVIGDSFAVRELVADSKLLRQFLVLILSDKECRFYLAGEDKLEPLKTDIPAEVYAYVNEKPERAGNFSDPGDRREIVMDKFLHYMDRELSRILSIHPCPVFVLGPEKVTGHFKAHSRHLPQISAYVHGNYIDAGEPELRTVIQPALETWRRNHLRTLLDILNKAADNKLLTPGISDASAAARQNKGRLLLVENSYRLPPPDAVDALIGQVIARGGDVEFVDDGALKDFDHIALIRYY